MRRVGWWQQHHAIAMVARQKGMGRIQGVKAAEALQSELERITKTQVAHMGLLIINLFYQLRKLYYCCLKCWKNKAFFVVLPS